MSNCKSLNWLNFGNAVKAARDKRGDTQKQLADKMRLAQATVSHAEAGDPLRSGTAAKLAKELGLELADYESPERVVRASPTLSFCGFTRCPSVHLDAVDGVVFVVPEFQATSSDASCRYCGHPLLDRCPNPQCGHPVSERRLRCGGCNQPYVEVPAAIQALPPDQQESACARWSERNAEIRRRLRGQE